MQSITTDTRYRQVVPLKPGLAGAIFGANKRVLKGIANKVERMLQAQGKQEQKPWMDTFEMPGSVVVYAHSTFSLNQTVKALREREHYIINKYGYSQITGKQNQEPKKQCFSPEQLNKFKFEHGMICDQIMDELMDMEYPENKEEEEAIKWIEELIQDQEEWTAHCKYGLEHRVGGYSGYDHIEAPIALVTTSDEDYDPVTESPMERSTLLYYAANNMGMGKAY